MAQSSSCDYRRWRLVIAVAIAALISGTAYLSPFSIVRLDKKSKSSRHGSVFSSDEISGRDLAKGLGVRAWNITVRPDESRRHVTKVVLRVVDTGTNVESVIAAGPINPTEETHIQVFLMPVPIGTSLSNAEEIDLVFSIEGNRSRERIRSPFFMRSTAEPELPTEFADDVVLVTTVSFVGANDVERNRGMPSNINLVLTFAAR